MAVAFGPLKLSPDVFWDMIPADLFRLQDGYQARVESDYQKLAWQTALLMNATGNYKKPVTPDQLLGNSKKPEIRPAMTDEEKAKAKAAFQAELEAIGTTTVDVDPESRKTFEKLTKR